MGFRNKVNTVGFKERCADCQKMKLLVYGTALCAKCYIKREKKKN